MTQISSPVVPSESVDPALPVGNFFQGPFRDARALDFASRVDALWPADGDAALAARLLRVTPESLMASFESEGEGEALVAWCERPADWQPEHSLSRDFGVKADLGRRTTLQETEGLSDRWIHGLVDDVVVVSFLRPEGTGSWQRIVYDKPDLPLRVILACEEATYRHVVERSRALALDDGAELVVTFEPSESEARTRLPF
jgi:hypothetical protein